MQGKNGKTKRLSVKDNRLKSRKPKAETPPQIIKYRDDSTRQQFRERHGEPDAGDPGHTGQQQESGNQKDEASKQSERSGGSYPFKTLIIPDDDQVHDEKDETRRKQRKPFDSDKGSRRIGIEEEPDQYTGTADEQSHRGHTAHNSRCQCDPSCLYHPPRSACPEVIANDRLCRLRNGVADHEHKRNVVAGDAERSDAHHPNSA